MKRPRPRDWEEMGKRRRRSNKNTDIILYWSREWSSLARASLSGMIGAYNTKWAKVAVYNWRKKLEKVHLISSLTRERGCSFFFVVIIFKEKKYNYCCSFHDPSPAENCSEGLLIVIFPPLKFRNVTYRPFSWRPKVRGPHALPFTLRPPRGWTRLPTCPDNDILLEDNVDSEQDRRRADRGRPHTLRFW